MNVNCASQIFHLYSHYIVRAKYIETSSKIFYYGFGGFIAQEFYKLTTYLSTGKGKYMMEYDVVETNSKLYNIEYKRTYKKVEDKFYHLMFNEGIESVEFYLNYLIHETTIATNKINQVYAKVKFQAISSAQIAWRLRRGLAIIKLITDIILMIWDRAGIISITADLTNEGIKTYDKLENDGTISKKSLIILAEKNIKDKIKKELSDPYEQFKRTEKLIDYLKFQVGKHNLSDEKTFNRVLYQLRDAEFYKKVYPKKSSLKLGKYAGRLVKTYEIIQIIHDFKETWKEPEPY